MNIADKGNEFLRLLSIVSQDSKQISVKLSEVTKSYTFDRFELILILKYLRDKKYIEGNITNIENPENNESLQDKIVTITADGYDKIDEVTRNKDFKIIRFLYCESINSNNRTDFIFYYQISNDKEVIKVRNKLKIEFTENLEITWQSKYNIKKSDLKKVLFQYAKEEVIKRFKNGILSDFEELLMSTETNTKCLYTEIDLLSEPNNTILEVEVGNSYIVNSPEDEKKPSTQIIELRNVINVRFKSLHNDKLFVNKEMDVIDLMKKTNTESDFTQRLIHLSNLVQGMNISVLRKEIEDSGTDDKSITLLEKYFKKNSIENTEIVKVKRCIVDIRNGISHTESDEKNKTIKAYEYLNLDYPITDNNKTWNSILKKYHRVLKQLDDIFVLLRKRKLEKL